MLTYKAAYEFVDGGVHAHALDFPGAITCGADLAEARRLLASALRDLAELCLERGEPLPRPNASLTDPEADLEEPIYLHRKAGIPNP
jgi:predicted RNase H-like HicB family nuclease